MCAENDRGSCTNLGEFFNSDNVAEIVSARSSILLRNIDSEQTDLCHLLYGFTGEAFLIIDFSSEGLDLFFCKIMHELPDELLLFGKVKIHY